MAAGRKENLCTFCWLLAIVLALQATVSLAFPVLHTELRPEGKKSCIAVYADKATIQPAPGHVARSLEQRQVQDYVLPLAKKETIPSEEEEEAASALLKGDAFMLCPSEWKYKSLPPKLFISPHPVSGRSKEHQPTTASYLLLSGEALGEIAFRGNVSLTATCTTSLSYCFNIFYSDSSLKIPHTLLRRSANNQFNSPDTPSSSHATPVLVVIVVAVVSLAVLISLVALCAGSSAYEPQQASGGVTLQKSPSEGPTSEPTVQFNSSKPVNVEVESAAQPAASNGAVKEKTTEVQKTTPEHRDSLDPTASPNREESERETRSRTLSARSFDPLPEIPKLETAEEAGGQRSSSAGAAVGGGGGMDDEDDEAGYAYARVGGTPVAAMNEADSDKEDKDKDGKEQKSELPPYGKVSHHVTKPKATETEQYAEVKEVFRGPLAHMEMRRGRSATEPIDPAEVGQDGVREKRALTHTHMMPLPDVPKPAISADDNDMYDSIPEDMRTSSEVPQPQVQTPVVVAATPPTKPRPKERLYESMDDMEEDTYESVPDNLRAESPLVSSLPTPPRSPSKSSTLPSSTSPPLPPTSPIPKPQAKEPEKKAVEKTLSASQVEGDGKRRFSFFSRKKTASVSAGVGKKKEKEKEKHTDGKDHHAAHQPLPDVPALSPVMSPPLPPIPANDDDDDTMYDTPQLDFMSGPLRGSPGPAPVSPGTLDAKAKSQSLPSSARSAGGVVFHGPRANIPLPRVPEDSGQGIVIRERVLESPTKGVDEEKPYDSVKISDKEKPYDSVKVVDELEDINEPNYDTVDKEEIFKAVAEAESMEVEPGYDRVKQLGNGVKVERGRVATPPATEGDDVTARHESIPRSLSPEDDTRGTVPEHDEEGYACVPEDFRMRKRALSASKGTPSQQVKPGTPETTKRINEGGETTSPAEPVEPSEPYATVDIIAKKQTKRRDTLDTAEDRVRQRSPSPIPPPVPPVGDLGEVAAEFSKPPVPIQSEDILELVPPDDSSLLKPPGSDDPPYAKVKSKDHPYAELDLGAVGEAAKLTMTDENAEAGYDKVCDGTSRLADLKDSTLTYDTVTDHEVSKEEVDSETLGHTEDQASNEEPGYDTVVDSHENRGAARPSQIEQETPKLEPAEPQQLYDSLEPMENEEKVEEAAGNLYDTLEPDQPQQIQNGVSPEDVEEQRYEEIDEDTRMELIAKQKQWSQGKLS